MKLIQNSIFYLAIGLVFLSLCTQEIEGRRRILRGRQVITRTYNRGLAVPAWAIVLMCGIGMIIIGAVLYFVLHKVILKESSSRDFQMGHVYTAAAREES